MNPTGAGEDFVPDEIPEKLSDHCLIQYFRCRYHKRAELWKGFSAHDKNRVEKENDRIEKLRRGFKSRNEKDIELLTSHRDAWVRYAVAQHENNLRDVESRVEEMIQVENPPKECPPEERRQSKTEKSRPRPKKGKLGKDERQRRVDLEKRILESVKGWKTPPAEVEQPRQGPDPPRKLDLPKLISQMLCGKRESPQKIPKTNLASPWELGATSAREFPPQEDSYGISIIKITLKTKSRSPSSYMKPDSEGAPPTEPKGAPPIESKGTLFIQRYPLNEVLYDREKTPLKQSSHEPDTIRYFHFPANNMHWIEEAIARYYGEDTPGEFNYHDHKDYRKKSSNVLCREFWTSRQHGGIYDPVHARHMRSHCSFIMPSSRTGPSTGLKRTGTGQFVGDSNNFVIFMPYLHWETHKNRKKMAEIAKEVTRKQRKKQPHIAESLREDFVRMVEEIKLKHAWAFTERLWYEEAKGNKKAKEEAKEEAKEGNDVYPVKPLGKYLLQVAKVYDAMDIESDVRILQDHLHKEPPLHPRRTLDQSYYWKLPNTDGRDEDQVVYRETKTGKSVLRTSRVVMVDQLWLYILDDHTIISSFPRRWGRHKPDWSGIHKSIRGRLEHLRHGEIQSVYDLALLIMNQCSTVFFDRTKSVDERPEVIDIFSNALSHVSGMKTLAFQTFWHQLKKLNANDRGQAAFEAMARVSLNINPEGELLREIHDIIEELRMMARIFQRQSRVVEDFSGHLKKLSEIENVPTTNAHGNSNQNGASPAATPKESTVSSGTVNSGSQQNHGNEHYSSDELVPKHTLEFVKRVSQDIQKRKDDLQELEDNAVIVSQHLQDLLTLKQQQASIIEAKYALKRADESVKQGRSIMLFTIVTIIFLPLSFMSSVFGMNASDFSNSQGGNTMSLNEQFRFMFPISVGVIVISIALAFSNWTRNVIYFLASVTWAVLFEFSSLRRAWLWCTRKKTPDWLYVTKQEFVGKIYSRRERETLRKALEDAKRLDADNNV